METCNSPNACIHLTHQVCWPLLSQAPSITIAMEGSFKNNTQDCNSLSFEAPFVFVVSWLDSFIHSDEFNINTQNTSVHFEVMSHPYHHSFSWERRQIWHLPTHLYGSPDLQNLFWNSLGRIRVTGTKSDSDDYACRTTAILCNARVHVSVENPLTLNVFVPQPQLTQAHNPVFCKWRLRLQ